MLRHPICASSERTSFFYLLMADSCFQRAANTANPGASNALRDIGRDYLVKATEVTSSAETTSRSAAGIETRRPTVGTKDGPDRQHIGGTG